MTITAYSLSGKAVGQVEVTEVVHSKGYTYTVYGELAPHQKAAHKKQAHKITGGKK